MIGEQAFPVSDGTVTLREIRLDDSGDLYRWRMDPRSRPMFRTSEEVPYAAHEQLVRRYFDPASQDQWFIIEAAGKAVGTVALYDFGGDGACEWGRLVIEPARRRSGYARRALALLIEHARRLGVSRLRCEVLRENAAALGLYLDLGFQVVGSEQHLGRTFDRMLLELVPGER